MGKLQKFGVLNIALIVLILFSVSAVSAKEINIVNSKDWEDVYSVMLHSAISNEPAFFLNSETLASVERVFPLNPEFHIYQSKDDPYIRNLESQLESIGHTVLSQEVSDSLNLDLDPETGKYIVISASNYRYSIPIAPYAVKEGAWLLIADSNNVDEIEKKISGAESVLAMGSFPRQVRDQLEPYFDEWINSNNVFKDSQELAQKFGDIDSVVLADGAAIEVEFFGTKNPVLLSGSNKILDDTFRFLQDNNVKSVVIIGNQLAVVGEQIRTRSEKQISVFVKFGQSSLTEVGKIYGLSMFPLPQPTIGLDITRVVYDPSSEGMIVYYKNNGNTGLYALSSSIVVSDDNGDELGTTEDEEVFFVGADELLPVRYDLALPIGDLSPDTNVQFFTSYGLQPTSLDYYLTNTDKYGTPFEIGLQVEEIGDINANLNFVSAAYFKGLKRVGVELENPGDERVYFAMRLNGLIVNGLDQDFFKDGSILGGRTKVVYIPVELDKVDIEENEIFDLTVVYGLDEENMLKKLSIQPDFEAKTGNLVTGLVTGIVEGSPSGIATIIVLLAVLGMFYYFKIVKKKK